MKVVIDNNLPRSLARLLTQSNIQAIHVVDVELSDASDETIRKAFFEKTIVFVSRDADFWLNHPPQWAVIWIAIHNPTLAQIKGPICQKIIQIIPTLQSGQRVLLAADQIRIYGETS